MFEGADPGARLDVGLLDRSVWTDSARPGGESGVHARRLNRAIQCGPGPKAIHLLATVDGGDLSAADRVDLLRAWESQESWLAVRRAEAVTLVAGSGIPYEEVQPTEGLAITHSDLDPSYADVAEISAEAEVAAALRISTVSASRRIAHSRELLGRFREAVPLLESGQWSVGHLMACRDELANASDEATGRVLTLVAGHSATDTPGRLRRRLRKELSLIDSDAVVGRILQRIEEREAHLIPEPDLRATVVISGSWDSVTWAYRQLDEWARAKREMTFNCHDSAAAGGAGSSRPGGTGPETLGEAATLSALRADAFVQAARLLAVELGQRDLGEPTDPNTVVAVEAALAARGVPISTADGRPRRGRTWSTAVVMLTEASALGLADEPGFVPGYGFVPAPIARELLASAETWRRFIVDDESGRLIDAGANRYRPSDRLRELVTARDQTCSFDPCERSSLDSDLDHVQNFDGANTTAGNLRPPCRSHHRLKTHGGWRVEVLPDGFTQWTSPTGHKYREYPDPLWQRLSRTRPSPRLLSA